MIARAPYTPYAADYQETVQSATRHASCMRVQDEMRIIKGRKQAPAAIDLRIVFVDL